MNLRDKLDKIVALEGSAEKELPFEVKRILPNIRVFGAQIALCNDGDFLDAEDAAIGLKALLKELTPSAPMEKLRKSEKSK